MTHLQATVPVPVSADRTDDGGAVTVLRGITWDHPRGVDCLKAASAEYSNLHPGVEIQWDARPLREFEHTPIADLAVSYDLLAIDHPLIGEAVDRKALVALDSILPAAELEKRAGDSAGASHLSYSWGGHHWALGVDAACQVSAYRPDLLAGTDVPRTWEELAQLASEHGRDRIGLAANPTHLWCTLLSLCEAAAGPNTRQADGRPEWWGNNGIDPQILVSALGRLKELVDLCAPESLEHDPISLLDQMSEDDRYLYVPFIFGYVTYAHTRPGRARIRFTNPATADGRPSGTLTGGVGLAISAMSAKQAAAADFLAFVTDPSCQGGAYLTAGGQPGLRSVWNDPQANEPVDGFFSDTLPTMDRAFLRPRFAGFPEYQRQASVRLHEMFTAGQEPAAIAAELYVLWSRCVA